MSRAEFPKRTKRLALARAKDRCEGQGEWYGLPVGQRCNADLNKGVEFDHIDLEANSRDASLENCACVCIPCHRYKTSHRDIPVAAKTVRQRDKDQGIKGGRKWARPLMGTVASGWKRRFDGTAVKR